MKKIACFPLISLLLVFLASCTLDMEEWIDTEEVKGYDEVETIENEYLSLSYKYKPTTRSLTDTIQSYIAQIEADTVLYFMDNTPEKWLPKTDGQVVANCCKMFPMGLIARVLSVERTGGLIKVVTTYADLKDAYDVFDFDFNAILPSNSPEDIDTVQVTRRKGQMTRGMEADDSTNEVYVDWSLYNKIKQGKKGTRYSVKERYNSSFDETSSDTREDWKFSLGSKAVQEKIKKATNGAINEISGNFSVVTKSWIHKKVLLEQDYELTETEQAYGIKIGGTIGVKGDAASDLLKKALPKYSTKLLDQDDNIKAKVFPFPIPGSPIPGFVRIKPVFGIEFGLYGNFEYTWWLSNKYKMTEIVNNKVNSDPPPTDCPLPKNEGNLEVAGTFKVSMGVDITLGVGKDVGDDDLVGAGIYGILTGNLTFSLAKTIFGNNELGTKDGLSLTLDGEFGFRVFGGDFFDLDLTIAKGTLWEGFSIPYYPQVYMNISLPDRRLDENGEITYYQSISASFSNFGFFDLPKLGAEFVILLYEKEEDIPRNVGMALGNTLTSVKDPYWVLHEGENTEIINTYDADLSKKPEYEIVVGYRFNFYNKNNTDFWAVPALIYPRNKTNPIMIFADQRQKLRFEHKPKIAYVQKVIDSEQEKEYGSQYVYETVGISSGTPNGINKFEIQLPFILWDAPAISRYWDDWGVVYSVDDGHNPKFGEQISFMNTIKKSGKYLAKRKFESMSDLGIEVEAYIYYREKGSDIIRYIGELPSYKEFPYNVYQEHNFQYIPYSFNKSDEYCNLLQRTYYFETFEEGTFDWGFEKDGYKNISLPSEIPMLWD